MSCELYLNKTVIKILHHTKKKIKIIKILKKKKKKKKCKSELLVWAASL